VGNVSEDRALGAVVGSAVGDALGAPFEFGPAGAYSARCPRALTGDATEMVGGGGFGWEPGEFTDDTQMAIVQAESLLAWGTLDEGDLFERFRVWASEATDVGNQNRAVLGSGRVASEAATAYYARNPRNSAGNGALMRSTLSAVLGAGGTLGETIALARMTASVTHGDPAAGWGTAIHHVMLRAALRREDPFDALHAILDALPEGQKPFRDMLRDDWTPDDGGFPNGTVWGCLAQAVWAVRSTSSFSSALVTAIDLGGDTDTVAAVAGGLAGAIYGFEAIPQRWTDPLHGTVTTASGPVTWTFFDLIQLTRRLLSDWEQPPRARTSGHG
jgi:ADP-ribosyl-[dinitrogen reductase] hydrolase